jgi:hypothetical protein
LGVYEATGAIPPDLEAFVLRLLEKKPAQRFRDVGDAAAATPASQRHPAR